MWALYGIEKSSYFLIFFEILAALPLTALTLLVPGIQSPFSDWKYYTTFLAESPEIEPEIESKSQKLLDIFRVLEHYSIFLCTTTIL